ncbi:CoA transferase [Microbaculum marinum]|uniref:CoA transferase n=1 Tax=Microbaculum marinum TaxID=1764581 RepID=A0AAW9RVU0_9HYPH
MSHVLDGIRVLDFSRVFAAPDSTQVFGDLGADVIKIETPDRGDSCRYLGVTREELEAIGPPSPSFRAFNRNKRSIALDLGAEAGRRVARRLVADADILVNNFRPGTMERWGLGYDELKEAHPRLIYCDFTAYGSEGPLSHIGANDLALQAHSGLMSITGEEGGGPVRAGAAIIDLHASLAIVSGVLAALYHREKTGRGQRVETSLLQSSAHFLSYFYQDYWLTGNLHERMGTANHLSVPNQAFPTSDGYVVIIAPSDEMWKRCAQALDAEKLDVERFSTSSERLRLRKEVIAAMSQVTMRFTKHELHEKLSAARVNVSIVQDIGEAADHPQLRAIGGVFDFETGGAPHRYIATPFRLSETPGTMRSPPPGLGEQTDEILRGAGYSAAEIDALRADGAFGET